MKGFLSEDFLLQTEKARILHHDFVKNMPIFDYQSLLNTIHQKHDFFHEAGYRISDHRIDQPYSEAFTLIGIRNIFDKPGQAESRSMKKSSNSSLRF